MRSIAIIGAGQSGLQLAFGLLRDGFDVTLYSDKTPEDYLKGRLPSSNALFGRGLDRERELDICFWDGDEPVIDKTFVNVTDPVGNLVVSANGRFARNGQSVDQRLKFSTWLEAFAGRGGQIVYQAVDLDGLEKIAASHELTIVSAGKGEITKLFALDQSKMTYNKPQRSIGMCSLVNVEHPSPNGVAYNIYPGIGEVFGIPMLTAAGPAVTWVMEAIPGGPMDRWSRATGPAEMLALAQQTFAEYFPWEVDRHKNAELADENAYLCGAVPPLVRKPIATLPSGRKVVGMGDVVVLNDPCTGQGANNASAHAEVMYDLIKEQEDRPFDEPWMQQTFDRFWEYAQWPTLFANTMLAPPTDHAYHIIGACGQFPEVVNRFTNAFNDPRDLQGWFYDPEAAQSYIGAAAERHEFRQAGRNDLAHI
ncbi:styrene monooxygenase/indole monooxygenase family protein [Rhodococcus sp. MSC1_016]|uniref:styrene monooxygenase/indole monooxygenase family protein n=1 Tax=Rhodococcus sp. MSC1_016 TaxID=2909266 RepID=UPI00202FE158|nr:styrene monooxygenase/indole monooxygenase family protein [Rhodococcus sp. MSC1_016]